MTFANHHERQLMQRLRGAGWVKASALPSSPGLVQKLQRLDRNKIRPDRSCPLSAHGRGLNAKKLPIPIPQRRRPFSKGKISD